MGNTTVILRNVIAILRCTIIVIEVKCTPPTFTWPFTRREKPTLHEIPDEYALIDKYDRVVNVDWESCNVMLDVQTQQDALVRSWDGRRM